MCVTPHGFCVALSTLFGAHLSYACCRTAFDLDPAIVSALQAIRGESMRMKTMQLILLKAIFVTVITVGPIGIAHAFQAEAPVAPHSSTLISATALPHLRRSHH
jgi:hypothetical protein